jgi:hypothetical protein
MTEATYRKKALPHLLKDFNKRCAYCLDPDEFRHPSQNQIDHFDCKISGRKRHQYWNLMLACGACNLSKHDKPVQNPLAAGQRLLNCTEETEFPEHVIERPDGQWEALTDAGEYHLVSIGLKALAHTRKRHARRAMAQRILSLCTTAIQYKAVNPGEVHNQLMNTIVAILALLDVFPPMVTEKGVMSVREWMIDQGVDMSAFTTEDANARPVAQPEVIQTIIRQWGKSGSEASQ